jgi:hypothetical protein
MKPAFTFILALVAMPAVAADWVAIGKAGSVDQYFYDRSKLTIKDDQITYWKKVLFAELQNINGKEVASGLLRERIDCAEHTAKLVSYLYYAPTGETVEYVAKDESEAAPIIPDTVGDAFEQKLCPLVWRKQEEARIKAEQRAAEAELSAIKRMPATDTSPSAPAPASSPVTPAAPTPNQPPTDLNATPVVPAPAEVTPAQPTSPAAPVPASPSGPTPAPRHPLSMPQIIEQLY